MIYLPISTKAMFVFYLVLFVCWPYSYAEHYCGYGMLATFVAWACQISWFAFLGYIQWKAFIRWGAGSLIPLAVLITIVAMLVFMGISD